MNNINSYGLIFRDKDDDIWLGLYENDTVREFRPLSDYQNVYENLAHEKFAFVSIQDSQDEKILVSDICSFELGDKKEKDDEGFTSVYVTEILEQSDFPSDNTDTLFRKFLVSAGKTH